MAPPSNRARALKVFSAGGVIGALLCAALVNVLAFRHYERWDWTSSGLYTLSAATLETLHSLREPVEVVVFLSASDPLTVNVRQMLQAYRAETDQLSPKFVDPDRNPAEFLALQQKYAIMAGKTEDGRVVTDASIVIARGERHWYVTTDDIVSYDEEGRTARPRLEQALTEGLRNVLLRDKSKICFSSGHQEASTEDGGAVGLAELRFRLQKSNHEVETKDLRGPKLPPLAGCRVLVIAGPEVPFAAGEAEHVRSYLVSGGNLLVLASAGLSADNRMQALGLEPVARAVGIELHNDVVIEADESLRLSEGMGETFVALASKTHPISAGLAREGSRVNQRVIVSLAQSMSKSGASEASPLLTTSTDGFGLREIRSFIDSGEMPRPRAEDRKGPLQVAMAAELPKAAGAGAHGPRAVFGPPSLAYAKNWRDPTLLGNASFVESALSWLAAEPRIVNVPEKPAHAVGLALSQESLGEVMRYVVLYMPGSAALLGVFVLVRRRGKRRSKTAEELGQDRA